MSRQKINLENGRIVIEQINEDANLIGEILTAYKSFERSLKPVEQKRREVSELVSRFEKQLGREGISSIRWLLWGMKHIFICLDLFEAQLDYSMMAIEKIGESSV